MPSHMEGSKVGKEDVMEFIKNASASAVMQGELQVRPSKGGDVWIDHSFVLTTTELLVLETTTSDQTEASEVVGMYDICPSCSVFETNLGQFTFELVTPRKILHVKSESREVTAAWIDCIRKVIADSEPNMADPVLQLAIAKIEEDVFYDVSFHDDKVPLGIVFERSGEWAMVKSAMKPELGVRVGSALSSVNGESCIFKSHEYTIGKLKNWKPPLHLGFRLPVTKNGYLAKRPQSGSKMGWKVYFFSLGGGRLIYKDDEANSKAKGGVPLKGSAVSLISSSEIGKSFCIRVVSGVTSLVMQGETQDEMMDWAATLYHAIAIANGGGHIISLERKRRDEEISFQQKKLAEADMKRRSVASAEEERLAKQKADEEEALAAQQAADEVAAAKRKAEEDAARLLAEENAAREEEERLKREQFERQERKIEEANCMLEGAIEIEDAPTLETAIGAVEGMDVAHLVEKLPLAKQKLQELGGGPDMMAKEAARVKAEEDAARIRAEQEEARVKAEEEAAAQEAARIRAEEEAARVRAEEEAALREEVRLREEEEARVRAEEEAVRQREEEEAAKERAEQDALLRQRQMEIQLAQEELLSLLSSPSLSMESLDELEVALANAEKCGGVDETMLEDARVKVVSFTRKKQNIEEVRSLIHSAIMSESISSVEVALNHASSINYRGEEVTHAMELLRQWREEEEREIAEKEARLAKEAALLDEELAMERAQLQKMESRDLSVVHEAGESEEDDDDEDDDDDDDPMSPGKDRRSSLVTDRVNSFSGGGGRRGRPSMERRASHADANRKLGTVKERLQADELRRHQEELHSYTTDEQLARFFHSYARVIDGFEDNEPLLTPVQFSSILRLVTGEKGNLFSEMKTFNKFDDDGNGYINVTEFVEGFKDMAKTNASVVDRISHLVGQDNVII
eukprot:CAMPEP_0114425046 /NCGR_PEP_ID=MMETSP0103-20121206/7024_1 /TAXON_ID=37642 ORGANISM="Paraphysomonas imperforata, Strain PA2" /NCGR_SAMPLE_ID=MMETSP0103 /ASSEMBLY_ACC=CAM_ASM_000201 /LENGTH=917 /DNA_ID=CAMNT_0001593851 /DNA_START=18 /DNA_END=2771 /DNA_ORIENTATION=-